MEKIHQRNIDYELELGNGERSYKNRKNLSKIIQHLEHEYTKKDDAKEMDQQHDKVKSTIDTDNVLLRQGIDEYQFKIKKTNDMTRCDNIQAIIYEQRMVDASEKDLFLSPEALEKFKNANIKN